MGHFATSVTVTTQTKPTATVPRFSLKIIPCCYTFRSTTSLFLWIIITMNTMKFVVTDLLGEEEGFQMRLKDFQDPKRPVAKLSIFCGPEFDAMGYGHDDDDSWFIWFVWARQRVPENCVEQISKRILHHQILLLRDWRLAITIIEWLH